MCYFIGDGVMRLTSFSYEHIWISIQCAKMLLFLYSINQFSAASIEITTFSALKIV